MNISKKDLHLIVGWFERIRQVAADKKTLDEDGIMSDEHAFNRIKVLAKDSAEFIRLNYLSKKTEVKPRNSAKVKTQGLHKRMGYER